MFAYYASKLCIFKFNFDNLTNHSLLIQFATYDAYKLIIPTIFYYIANNYFLSIFSLYKDDILEDDYSG